VRRKFVDATKVSASGSNAYDMLELIRRLYEVEHAAEQGKLAPRQIAELRQQKALPRALTKDQTPPQGLPGKATGCTLCQRQRLTRYVENGIPRPDNYLAYAARGMIWQAA
jgi:hypothetical protein